MAANKARPTRPRPAKNETTEPAVTPPEPDAPVADEKPARKPRQARKPAAAKLSVFHEDTETGVLTPVGEFKGDKADDALVAYFAALEADDYAQALEAATYAVETPKGLVRLTATQKLEITAR